MRIKKDYCMELKYLIFVLNYLYICTIKTKLLIKTKTKMKQQKKFTKLELEIILEIMEEQKKFCEENNLKSYLKVLNNIYSKLIVLNNNN